MENLSVSELAKKLLFANSQKEVDEITLELKKRGELKSKK